MGCASGKRTYYTEDKARKAAKHSRKHGSNAGFYYECALCGHWHLSSRVDLQSLAAAVVSGETQLVEIVNELSSIHRWSDRQGTEYEFAYNPTTHRVRLLD